MDFEGFKAALTSVENGEELSEFFESYITSNDDKRKITEEVNKRKKASNEAASLKRFKIAMESLGYDGESDLDDFVETLTDTIEGKSEKSNSELSSLQKDLKKLQKDFQKTQSELESERQAKAELVKKNKSSTIESQLLPRLDKEIFGAKDKIKVLLYEGALDIDENGKVVVRDGDDELSVEDGVKWIINNSERKNNQAPGSDTKPNTKPSTKPKYTKEQIDKMSIEEVADNYESVKAAMTSK